MYTATDNSNVLERLTVRQRTVFELVGQRVAYKEIAARLGCTESAVNQHVRKLKDRLDIYSLRELECLSAAVFAKWQSGEETCRSPACRSPQLPESDMLGESLSQDSSALPLTFQDAQSFVVPAPWARDVVPRVVPGVLNGQSSALVRSVAIMALTGLLFAVLVLAITAGRVLTDVFPR
jgi:DNA-binding CsgD family transcriptional regulator